jgi:hypothetical protein
MALPHRKMSPSPRLACNDNRFDALASMRRPRVSGILRVAIQVASGPIRLDPLAAGVFKLSPA